MDGRMMMMWCNAKRRNGARRRERGCHERSCSDYHGDATVEVDTQVSLTLKGVNGAIDNGETISSASVSLTTPAGGEGGEAIAPVLLLPLEFWTHLKCPAVMNYRGGTLAYYRCSYNTHAHQNLLREEILGRRGKKPTPVRPPFVDARRQVSVAEHVQPSHPPVPRKNLNGAQGQVSVAEHSLPPCPPSISQHLSSPGF